MTDVNMSSRERFLKTCKHCEPDRVPIFLESTPPLFFTDRVRWYNQFERAKIMLDLGCDPMINIWLPEPVLHPDVTVKVGREKKSDGRILLSKEFHTPKGVLRQVIEETKDWCDFRHGQWAQYTLGTGMREEYGVHIFDDWAISRRIEPWVKGQEDLQKLPFILQKPPGWMLEEWRHDAKRALEYARKHELLTMVRRTITNDASQWMCDIPWFMMQLYDDEEFVKEFLEIFEAMAMWQTEGALELGGDVFQHRGWYDGPNFWGGSHFKRYILPFLKRHVALVHEAGVKHCYLLTQGWRAYVQLFKEVDTDILWGADPVQVGMDLKELKEKIGKHKVILGGISSEQHLTGCTEEHTRKAVRDAMHALAPGGGYIFGTGSAISGYNNWKNIEALIDEAHKIGKYPIKT